MKIKKICKQCGKEFWVSPYREKSAKYCSMKCYNPKKRVKKICLSCGKEFETWPSKKERKYCSMRCRTIAKITRRKLLCSNCGKEIFKVPSTIKKVNFCSHKCYGEYKKIIYISFCENCGKSFKVNPSRIKRGVRYCSLMCSYLDNKEAFLKGAIKARFQKNQRPWNKGLNKETNEMMQIMSNKKLGQKRTKRTRESMSKISKKHWQDDGIIFNYFKGSMFGKGYDPNELDKKIIRARI